MKPRLFLAGWLLAISIYCARGQSYDLVGPFVPGTGHWTTIKEGDFEYAGIPNGNGHFSFDSTAPFHPDWDLGSAETSKAAAYSGQYGMAINAAKTVDTTGFLRTSLSTTVVPGRTYVISAFVKRNAPIVRRTEYTGFAAIAIDEYKQFFVSHNTTEWQFIYCTYWPNRNQLQPAFTINGISEPNGQIYLDEIAITPVEQFVPPTPVHLPAQAKAKAIIEGGSVTRITVTNPGAAYVSPPVVVLDGGGGTGATATAATTNGFVDHISVVNPGTGYVSPPVVYINSALLTPRLELEASPIPGDNRVKMIYYTPNAAGTYILEQSASLPGLTPDTGTLSFQSIESIQFQWLDTDSGQRYFHLIQ